MKKEKKELILDGIGLFLWGYLIIILFNIIRRGSYESLLWACYTSIFLIVMAIFLKKPVLIVLQIPFIFASHVLYTFDFVYILIYGKTLFGLAYYPFTNGVLLTKIVSLQHLFTAPLALYALFLMKFKKINFGWLIVLGEIIIFYILSVNLTKESSNVNCVYRACTSFSWGTFPLAWFYSAIFLTLLTYFILINIPLFLEKNKRKKK